MLNIKFVAENPEVVKRDLRRRKDREKVKWIDDLLKKYSEYGQLLYDLQNLRKKRNEVSLEIGRLKKERKSPAKLLREIKDIPKKIEDAEKKMEKLKEKIDWYLMRLPNIMHKSVPEGADEDDNKVVRKWGTPRKFTFRPMDHIDLTNLLDFADTDKAAEVAGARFYYLKNELVLLNYALIKFALDFIAKRGYKLLQPPYMLKRQALSGAVDLSDFEDVIYKVEGEDLHLIGTSEHSMLAFHMGEIIEGGLPIRYAAMSPCFRKEAGSHGRDTKGIFRVHQFEKVEQFIFCRPEESWEMHEELIKNMEEFFKALKIPYRIMNVCTGDLGTVAAKKYDLEGWLPGQGKYRELGSCSNCTDYQARRSGIRFRNRTSDPTKTPHTLNSTLVATERALIAILENYQQKDGNIKIPDVLVPYMNGRKYIGKK
ncbi:MAG: serine--tRNA ligase [Candidatus Aenigmatarchaeota archaeon]|nr:MAG: serine--tRNA ligase [Candidatus Aenigmarchaeota archaeon]